MSNGEREFFTPYIRVKRNLKWYIKLFNIITFHKDRNYEYKTLGKGVDKVDVK